MATKAELEAELTRLKAEMAAQQAAQEAAARSEAREAQDAEPEPEATPASDENETPTSMLADALKGYGIDPEDLDKAWKQLSDELDQLPQKKPMLTALVAFGAGFILGRVTK